MAITGDILTETFDNAGGYDVTPFFTSGTVDPNYTGTVLEGTQSLLMTGTSTSAAVHYSFTSRSSVYVYFQLRLPNLPSDNTMIFVVMDSPFGSYLTRLLVQASGSVFLLSGASFSGTSSGALSANTTYHFWLTYIKGTGANAFTSVGFSTTGTRPTSGSNYVEITDSNVTANCTDAELEANPPSLGGTWTPIFDRFCLNTTQIGDATAADVTVNLTGVSASPAVGTGTVTIGSAAVTPPEPVLVAGGRPLYWFEDEKVSLTGVAADPQVGEITPVAKLTPDELARKFPFPRRHGAEEVQMPPGMRGLFKPVEKPIPPAIFVYAAPFPRLRSAVGDGKVIAHFEDIDEELMALLGVL